MPIITISSIKEQTKTSNAGKKYKVVVVEGVKYGTNEEWSTNIFKNQTALIEMVDEFGPGEIANFKFKKNGNYWDLVSVEEATEENLAYALNPTPSGSGSGAKKSTNTSSSSDKMSKADWAKKDRDTKESIARAVAIKLAMDNTKQNTKANDLIAMAKEYLPFLLGEEVSEDDDSGDPLDPDIPF